ncbi:hypothetical protein LTS18_014907, partial [Coniosporium uncinatum]
MADLRTRHGEAKEQNRLLHQQLESVNAQINALKQTRTASLAADGETNGDTPIDNSQEIIKFLRQEKEIVDLQYDLALKESRRFKDQLDYTQSQLEQTREKLNQERLSQAAREQSTASHTKLMSTVNELNLFRESNASLRNEARQAEAQLAIKRKEVENLQTQILPIQARINELENTLETTQGMLKLTEEDRDHWRQRNQDIMTKYDRVDPGELEALRTQISTLHTERDEALAEKQPLENKIAELEAASAAFEERRKKLMEQARSRDESQKAKIREANENAARFERELNAATDELKQTRTARDEALQQLQQAQQQQQDAQKNGVEDGQVQEDEGIGFSAEEKADLEAKLSEAEARAKGEADRAASLQLQVDVLQARVQELEGQVNDLQQRLDTATAESLGMQEQI